MWLIRDSQMVALDEAALASALERLAAHLRIACPRQTEALTDEELLLEVERGVEHAKRHDFENDGDIRVFLECRMELGPDFDTREDTAWARDVLADDTLFPAQKADLLADRHVVMAMGGPNS